MNDRTASQRPGERPAADPARLDDGDFEVIRGLLDEANSGRPGSTLETWRTNARERLAGAARESVSPARTREIQQVAEAYEVATELVEAILREARRAAGPSRRRDSLTKVEESYLVREADQALTRLRSRSLPCRQLDPCPRRPKAHRHAEDSPIEWWHRRRDEDHKIIR